ncbi:MAG: hypothetical protein RLZZ337_663 [Bacteroidota bacterium]|jgi:GDPmannose 4,6-dehydratase
MKKTACITGITGQDGPYLAKFLLEKDYHIYGLMKRYSNPNLDNLKFLGISNEIDLITGDITDDNAINHIVKLIKPNEFYNLAAQSFVGSSWDLNKVTTEINSTGVLNVLNAIKNNFCQTKFYQAGTSEMFGNATTEYQNLETPFRPRSPYGISKLYAHWMTINFRESFGLHASNGILFNHESPIRGKEFVTRKISDGVARIKLGLQNEIKLGNLDSCRDWGFAGDFVEAMWSMLQQKEPGDYIVSTGESHSIREFLDIAFNHVGISNWEPYITIDPHLKRPAELYVLKGDCSITKKILNWSHKVSFKNLVEMMVNADMERLQ